MVYLKDFVVSETWSTNVASLCVASLRIQDSIAYLASRYQNESVCNNFFSLGTSIIATSFIDQVCKTCDSFSGVLEYMISDHTFRVLKMFPSY